MNHLKRPASDRSQAWRRWVITAVAFAGLCATFVALAIDPEDMTAARAPVPRQTASVQSSGPQSPKVPRPVTPERLAIPAIGVSTDLLSLGLNTDRTVEVPPGPRRAGWFNQGPAPGQPGSSVILGHVDSMDGPAVFYELRNLEQGDVVRVRLSDATVARFEVVRVATYPNEAFPAERVYAGTVRQRALNLITCGGDYDANAGGYQSNVVVYTRHLRTISGEA